MSGIIKVFLLLALLICISEAQRNESNDSCLCRRVSNAIKKNLGVHEIQIYPATTFCDKVEIVVTAKDGSRYCLNPKMKVVKQLLLKIMNNQTTTVRPAQSTLNPSSNPDRSSTANI